MMYRLAVLGLSALCSLGCAPALSEPGWPGWRGPRQDGSAISGFPGGPQRLTLEWKRSLGSGFSSVSVVGDVAVTMYSDGEFDRLVALRASDGEPIWEQTIGPTHRQEHPESHDGPLSTPVIHDSMAFAVGGGGELLAVRLVDGELLWSLSMPDEFGARAQQFGFATSPVVADGTLVVQTGAEDGRSTCGLDPATGERRWCHGSDPVGYQSPIRIEATGHEQVAVATDRHVFGLDPSSGGELWRLKHIAEVHDGIAQFVWMGDDRFLMSYLPYVAGYRLVDDGGVRSTVELWRSQDLLRNLAGPVIVGPHACGFRHGTLACIGIDDGKTTLAAEAGLADAEGRGLLRLDDSLVVWDAEGVLTIVSLTTEGMGEIDRLETGLVDSYSAPSFAASRIFVRNQNEIAAIRVGPGDG